MTSRIKFVAFDRRLRDELAASGLKEHIIREARAIFSRNGANLNYAPIRHPEDPGGWPITISRPGGDGGVVVVVGPRMETLPKYVVPFKESERGETKAEVNRRRLRARQPSHQRRW